MRSWFFLWQWCGHTGVFPSRKYLHSKCAPVVERGLRTKQPTGTRDSVHTVRNLREVCFYRYQCHVPFMSMFFLWQWCRHTGATHATLYSLHTSSRTRQAISDTCRSPQPTPQLLSLTTQPRPTTSSTELEQLNLNKFMNSS